MISVKDAIETAAWVEIKGTIHTLLIGSYDVNYRVRVTEFSKIELSSLGVCSSDHYQDAYNDFLRLIGLNANVWRLNLDIVCMNKNEMDSSHFFNTFCLADSDNYQFKLCNNSWINTFSPYAKNTGLDKLSSISFPPKIKKSAAYSIELPEFFDDIYISSTFGTAEEI